MNSQEIYKSRFLNAANKYMNEAVEMNSVVGDNLHYEDLKTCFVDATNYALQNLWISVEDALPEKKGRYLCNYRRTMPNSDRECDCVDFGLFKDGKWYIGNDEVTHWMQIPELKGGEE